MGSDRYLESMMGGGGGGSHDSCRAEISRYQKVAEAQQARAQVAEGELERLAEIAKKRGWNGTGGYPAMTNFIAGQIDQFKVLTGAIEGAIKESEARAKRPKAVTKKTAAKRGKARGR